MGRKSKKKQAKKTTQGKQKTPSPVNQISQSHPSIACERCGNFTSAAKLTQISGVSVCDICEQLPGVNVYREMAERLKASYDGSIFMIGVLGTLTNLALALYFVAQALQGQRNPLNAALCIVICLAGLRLCTDFFRRKHWIVQLVKMLLKPLFGPSLDAHGNEIDVLNDRGRGRLAPINLLIVVSGLLTALLFESEFLAVALCLDALVAQLFCCSVSLTSTRGKLAFSIPVSQQELEQHYYAQVENPMAHYGACIGILGVMFPGVEFLALPFSLGGLWAVNPNSVPPIGGKSKAYFGLACVIIGIIKDIWVYEIYP